MTTGTIIAIAVGAVVLIALIGWVSARRGATRQQRQLANLREQAAESERYAAEEHLRHAERMEQQAKVARASADLHAERANLHEEGLADHELVTDDGSPRDDLDLDSERDATIPPTTTTPGRFNRDTETETADTTLAGDTGETPRGRR